MRMLGSISAVAAAVAVWYTAVRPQPLPPVENRWTGHRHPDSYFQKRPFDAAQAHDLTGKVALVTGGSSGVGLEVARSLYAQGCTVVITSRSQERAERAAQKLRQEVGSSSGKLEGMALELSDLDDVGRFSKEFTSKYSQLHYLVENAGMPPLAPAIYDGPRLSKQGWEFLYASNYLGHFKLLQQLLPTLLQSAPARVTATSSISLWLHTSNLPDLLPDAQKKSMESAGFIEHFRQYGNTKFLQVAMCFEAQRRLTEAGLADKITITPATPGFVNTNIGSQHSRDETAASIPIAKSATEGAATTLYALLSEENKETTGVFIQPYFSPKHRSAPILGGFDVNFGYEVLGQRFSWGVYRWLAHPRAYSEQFNRELWDASMVATGSEKVL